MQDIRGVLVKTLRSIYYKYKLQIVVIFLFAVLGISLLGFSHAATPVISLEVEKGIVRTPAVSNVDATASNGQGVLFAATTSPSPMPPSSADPCPIFVKTLNTSCYGVPVGTQLSNFNGSANDSNKTFSNM